MTLRGAIVGFGNIALHGHLPGWLDRRDVEIVAVTDARPARRSVAEEHGPQARWHDSADELLARGDLDFVDICTPPSSHAGLIRAALLRGLHVLCEKPLVGSLEDLETVARLASESDRVVHTVHNWHHAPIIRRTGEMIRDGAIGRVRRVVWETLRTGPAADVGDGNWRVDPAISGGGVLTDHGWHVFYVLGRWIGARPTEISAALETRRHTRWSVEDTATLRLTFPDATAEILLTWASDVRRNWVEITGTDGALRLEDEVLVLARNGDDSREQRWACPPALSAGSHHPDWFHQVVEDFLSSVRGAAPRRANLAEASLCVALEALARESSRRGARRLPLMALALGPSVAWSFS